MSNEANAVPPEQLSRLNGPAAMRQCPFCYCVPVVIELDDGVWAVVCSHCNAIGPHPEPRQDRATAIQLWNDSSEPT